MIPPYPRLRFGRTLGVVLLASLFAASLGILRAWTPGTGTPAATSGFVVDASNRRDVLAYFHTVYSASEGYAARMAWTGSVTTGVAGTTSAAFKDDVRRRINFYRALAGLPGDITMNATKSAKAQDAALMMSANDDLDHNPPASWTYYTANGAEAAGKSNLSLGRYGPGAVDSQTRDDGSNNSIVGHRRWLLYSRAADMGTGDVPQNGSFNSANALWVIGDPKPAPAPKFVPWPNAGYVPAPLVPARWSLSYPNADFSAATVTMTKGGASVPTSIISSTVSGVGDKTLVWTPAGVPSTIAADTTYSVTVSGISGSGVPTSFAYTVTLFDPTVLGEVVAITGSNTPPTTGGTYSFNSISQADSYELKVSTASNAAWTEGAEDLPTPKIAPGTTGTYALRQASLVRTGSNAFHLGFPDFNDQSFTVTRDLVPGATSELQFYERGRFASTTTTLGAEISKDNGSSWTSLWSRTGVGLSSSLWDPDWISHSISLAAYAGQIVQVRFIMRTNANSIVIDTSTSSGFFLDDITVTNATELVSSATSALAGTATSFILNGTTAGAALVAGTAYYMRLRPNVGTRWFDFGPAKIVTPALLSSDARLANLVLSAGTPNPAFTSATTAYTAVVSNTTASITVTPTASEPNATITVQGTSVASGAPSSPHPLVVGSNMISTVVTAQDGTTKKTYTLTVMRLGLPVVTTLAASTVVFNGATLNGTVNPSGFAAMAHFEYGLTTTYGTSTGNQNVAAGSSAVPVQAAVTGLSPNTSYHYRLVATTSSGTGYGLDQTFTTPDNPLLVGTWAERTVLRSLPTTVGNAVDIGQLTFTGGTGIIEAAVNASGSGWSVAKRYVIPIRYNLGNGSPPATWLKVLPTHDTGPYGVNDFDLEVNVTGTTALLRLRTVGSTGVAATARIAIKTTGLQTFTNSSTTTPGVAAPTQTVGGNAVDELMGKAGIGVTPSGSAVVDMNGGDSRGLRLRVRTTAGPPVTGTWSMGTMILDKDGNLYICTAASPIGTPAGTWKKVGTP